MQPLRVAYFIEGMSASGVDTSTQLLAGALRKQGHEVVLFVPWKNHATEQNRDRLVRLKAVRVSARQPIYWTVPFSWTVYERFHEQRFDLVHVHTSSTINLLAWQVAAAQRLPIVYTYHTMSVDYAHYVGLGDTLSNLLVEPAFELVDRVVCNRADAIVAPSAKAERYLRQIDVQPPVHVIPNGIDLHDFRPQPSTYLHERLGIDASRPVLLFVGRLNHEKRPLLAYDLFRRIHAARSDTALVMVGDGGLRPDLEQRIAADGLSGSVKLAGLIPYADMPKVYNSAALWLSTSLSEVHPMVALEAGACGLPAVAWNDPALEGVVLPGGSGMIVDCDDDFVGAALRLLNDSAQRQDMAQEAAAHASGFSIEATAERMAALYRALLTGDADARTVTDQGRQRDLPAMREPRAGSLIRW